MSDLLEAAKEEISRLHGVIAQANAYCEALYSEMLIHRDKAEKLQAIVNKGELVIEIPL